ncbi:MAG TPA: dicarboxylate/amino acid:cation symporter [Phycisphaerae bacterium]|nr:dicarboxylate/amino acid:cation symporter [Phycisphaerae bacterium]
MNAKWLLTILIFAGLVLGIIAGQLLYDPGFSPGGVHAHAAALALFDFIGFTVFMGLLKMLIIPLIATSVIAGVTSVGDFSKLGALGARTLVYYFATMFMAVVLGLVLVTTFRPGDPMAAQAAQVDNSGAATGNDAEAANPPSSAPVPVDERAQGGLIGILKNLVSQMIPENVVAAAAAGQPLGIICFSIFFGVVATLVGAPAEPVVHFMNSAFEVLMRMVHVVMWIAPLGVFALLAKTIAVIGLQVFSEAIGRYMFVVLGGLAIHGLIVIPLVLWYFGKCNPFRFLHQMRQAMMTALATDSSSATLPVTIECATEQGGVNKRSAGFVLPLGSTINMDGTALYEAVAVVFIAQAFHIDLSFTELIIVAVTATLAAMGAAGIPSAGLVTMIIVIKAVNGSLTGHGAPEIPEAGIALIIGVDRLLDMFRTAVNVWGDAAGAKIIDRYDAK